MKAIWYSSEVVSGISTFLNWAIAVLGIAALVFGGRASVLQEKESERQVSRIAELESRVADRTINEKQRAHLIRRLSKFRGQEFDFVDYGSSMEASSYLMDICQALEACGWSGKRAGGPVLGASLDEFVFVLSSSNNVENPAAVELLSALKEAGIKAYPSIVPDEGEMFAIGANVVRIVVGPKK